MSKRQTHEPDDDARERAEPSKRVRLSALFSHGFAREFLILFAFLALTALMTWPWVTRLRDAVSDKGDPYMIAWTLWWDYHQTFNDPLNLFHANVFYPYRYTLAFSESDYGIALLFFPLYAAGLRPLTVHSFATFCGFAFSGYGAFRLARTTTNSYGAGFVAGIFFAFVPYRFHVLSHLHYLFAGWMPLLLEALVLFARERSRKRAAWLGVTFLMNALTCVTWFILTLPALALSAAFLVVRYRLPRERDFWLRGGLALFAASLALLPFLLPYHYASRLYGFTWTPQDVVENSRPWTVWLEAEQRNYFWKGFGPGYGGAPLFPGLLSLLLAFAALILKPLVRRAEAGREDDGDNSPPKTSSTKSWNWLAVLDTVAFVAGVVVLISYGSERPAPRFGNFFSGPTADRALFLLFAALAARLSLAYPNILRRALGDRNLVETIRAARRGDALWLGLLWAACGFLLSTGMNSFFFRFLYDNIFLFRSQRIPSRGAMVAYVGLSLLAGLGACKLAQLIPRRRPRVRAWAIYAVVAAALLFELRAAPLRFERGAVFPDALTLRLKETPMRGGLVELPTREDAYNHLYMLRAADHQRPLVNATSSFIPPIPLEIHDLTRGGPVSPRFLDLLEAIPASYLVVHNRLVAPERRPEFELFLAHAVETGRLRFVQTFGERDDLYAVTKTEPEAQQEAPLPFAASYRDWESWLKEDPVYLLGQYQEWSERIFRLHRASFARLPRMKDFLTDVQTVGRGVVVGLGDQRPRLEENVRAFADEWVARKEFERAFQGMNNGQYVDALASNAGLKLPAAERDALAAALDAGTETRAGVLRKLVDKPEFVRGERTRALVLLHYFGYLRRDPDAPPDRNLDGFDFWVKEVEASGDTGRLTKGFMSSYEYEGRKK